jgi:hypothetical protein
MEQLDALEERMQQLQQAMRRARLERDDERLKELRAELRRTQNAYEALFAQPDDSLAETGSPPSPNQPQSRTLLPAREQVHQVLTLLDIPAAPKLISSVHAAFFASALPPARLTSLRRDEERSYRSAPNARPYYLCPALTSDLLSPARGLLTISIWPLEQRIVGPLSARVHFLTGAIRIAQAAQRLAPPNSPLPTAAERLLHRYALNIPDAQPTTTRDKPAQDRTDLDLLRRAAEAELAVHIDADTTARTAAADRALHTLDDAGRLFGHTLHQVPRLRSVP